MNSFINKFQSMEQFHLPFLCFLVTILFASLTIAYHRRAYKTVTKRIPGPWSLPIIGNLHHFLVRQLLPHRILHDLALRYGPDLMLLRLGQVEYVVVSSRDATEDVFKTYDLNFSDRPQLAVVEKQSYGYTDIMMSPYGNYWRQLRKICVKELLTAKRVKSFSLIKKEETLNLIDEISASVGTPVNISRRLMLLSNAIVFRAALGKRCAHEDELIELMKVELKVATGTRLTDLFPSLGFLDVVSGSRAKLERIHRSFDEILDEVVVEHKKVLMLTKNREEDILDLLLRLKDSGDLDFPLTRQNVKAVMGDILGAGTETSSTTTEWVMAEMMRNPQVMKKAQTEVRQALLGKTNMEETDVANLSYLKLIIKETLRLHPPIPLIPRECRESCEVQGYPIPKGRRILVNVWALGRDPAFWKDPDCFKPERFEESPIDFKGTDFNFLPFGGGKRMCPGMTFAMVIVEVVLAHLLFYFEWELPDGMKTDELDMTENFSATVSLKKKLHLAAKNHVQVPID